MRPDTELIRIIFFMTNNTPTQLRIGSHIARPPEDKLRRKETRPERAFVNDDQIVAERWR